MRDRGDVSPRELDLVDPAEGVRRTKSLDALLPVSTCVG